MTDLFNYTFSFFAANIVLCFFLFSRIIRSCHKGKSKNILIFAIFGLNSANVSRQISFNGAIHKAGEAKKEMFSKRFARMIYGINNERQGKQRAIHRQVMYEQFHAVEQVNPQSIGHYYVRINEFLLLLSDVD